MLSAVTVGRSGVDKLETAQGEQHFHALLFSSQLKLGKSLGLIIMFFKLFLCGLFLHGRAHYHDFGCRESILVTVKSRAVDRSTIQFWNFLAKGHST